jgi:hypothetical protein
MDYELPAHFILLSRPGAISAAAEACKSATLGWKAGAKAQGAGG